MARSSARPLARSSFALARYYTQMVGAYENIGGLFPLYILQFNKHGESTSPETTAQILSELRGDKYSHVYLISHGWNNNFGDALGLYREFFNLFVQLHDKHVNAAPDTWRPLFIGLHWPSIILLLPWEKGPRFAGSDGDAAFESLSQARDAVAEEIPADKTARFYELTSRDRLSETDARELAAILAPLYRQSALDTSGGSLPDLEEDGIIGAWMAMPDSAAPGLAPNYGVHGRARAQNNAIRAASAADLLDPRNAIRVTTVLVMKDRSGDVGRFGLAPLLCELIPAAAGIPIRLIGHSFGARVCLTALSSPELASLRVSSLLLLQPAVNQYCFATSVPGLGLGVPGGFVPALARTGLPILTTFSSHDAPLRTFFHLAARRIQDRGEIRFASAGPSEFCALGGYGPDGIVPAAAAETKTIQPEGMPYTFGKNVKVLALDGSAGEIQGHGDVRSPYTAWALLSQEMANVL